MDRSNPWLGAALRAALLALFLWMIRSIAIPVALGAVFALILLPWQRRLAPRLGRLRSLAPLVLTAGTVVVVVIPFAVLAVRFVVAIDDLLAGGTQDLLDTLQRFGTGRLARLADKLDLDPGALRAHLGDVVQRAGIYLAGLVAGLAQAVPGYVVGLFLFTIALYYFLRDGRRFTRFLLSIAPFGDHEKDELAASVEATVRGAIVGQLATSGVQGGLTLVALFLFGVPGALVLAILATLLTVIPMVGTTPVTVGAAIYLLASGQYGAAAGMAVAAVIIGFSDNVVRPWVQSAGGTLHPLLALVSIFGGIAVFGAAGVFLGPVVAALAVWALDTYAARRVNPIAAK